MTFPDDLPVSEYGFPGALRDRLIAAILSGEKTATTSLVLEYDGQQEPLPRVGDRALVVNSAGEPVGIETIYDVRIAPLGEVDLDHAIAEGEGFTTVAEWRAGHERFWHSPAYLDELSNPDFRVTDDTLTVLTRFSFRPLR